MKVNLEPRGVKQLEVYISNLEKENQELKNQLEEYKLITIDYQELEARNKELKKQLTTYQILHRDCKVDNLKNISKIEEMENQQKEFINKIKELETKLKENGINE